MSEPSLNEVRDEYMFATQEVDMDGYVIVSSQEAYAQFDAALAAHDREVKAEAWDQGYEWVDSYVEGDDEPRTIWDNPYRIESQETP